MEDRGLGRCSGAIWRRVPRLGGKECKAIRAR